MCLKIFIHNGSFSLYIDIILSTLPVERSLFFSHTNWRIGVPQETLKEYSDSADTSNNTECCQYHFSIMQHHKISGNTETMRNTEPHTSLDTCNVQ